MTVPACGILDARCLRRMSRSFGTARGDQQIYSGAEEVARLDMRFAQVWTLRDALEAVGLPE
jgi:hypothetical protein